MPRRRRIDPPSPSARLAHSVQQLSALEQELERQVPRSVRVGSAVVRAIGSLSFIGSHLVLMAAWILWNTAGPSRLRFDPFPFGVLTMIVSLEGVLLAAFILLAQNHLSVQAERRERLNLHIDLLAEQQVTLLLRYVRQVSDHLGVAPPPGDEARTDTYAADTDVERLASEIDESMRTRS